MFTKHISQNAFQLFAVKGMIADCNPEQRRKIKEAIEKFEALIMEYGEDGLLALNYLVAFVSVEEETALTKKSEENLFAQKGGQ